MNALHGLRKVRVQEIVRNAFKKVRFVPTCSSYDSSLAVLAPQTDGRIQVQRSSWIWLKVELHLSFLPPLQEYSGPLPYIHQAEQDAASVKSEGTLLEEEFKDASREVLLREIARLRQANRTLAEQLTVQGVDIITN